MGKVGALVDVGHRREISGGDVVLLQLLHIAVKRGTTGEVVVDALVVDGRVVAEAHQRGAAFLARRLHKTRRAERLEVVEPLEGAG